MPTEQFKFNRFKNKFSWEGSHMKLEFSNPSIQAHYDYLPLKNYKGIRYYYYTSKIFKKVAKYNKKTKTWGVQPVLVSERHTFDFPCILQLKCLLEYQLKHDPRKNGQKTTYSNNSIRYKKIVSTEGFACDDFYEIAKEVDEKGKSEQYTVYCGSSLDREGDMNSVGIRLTYITRQELLELLKCVNAFIGYSIQKHNKSIKNYKNLYKIIGNKIYKFDKNGKKINLILAIGDLADTIAIKDMEQDEFEKVIKNISGDTVTFIDGSFYDIHDIVYLNREFSKEELTYNRQQIAEDFLKILSVEEQVEFIMKDIDSLVEKYGTVIIDRTAMCREEHGFHYEKPGVDNPTAIIPVVKDVIELIKNLI